MIKRRISAALIMLFLAVSLVGCAGNLSPTGKNAEAWKFYNAQLERSVKYINAQTPARQAQLRPIVVPVFENAYLILSAWTQTVITGDDRASVASIERWRQAKDGLIQVLKMYIPEEK